MKPKLRKEAEIDLQGALNFAIRSQLDRKDIYPFQSCLSCIHFKEITETCNLANQRPPAKIIVFGCNSYQDNQEVPF